jgi:hypothetical protein
MSTRTFENYRYMAEVKESAGQIDLSIEFWKLAANYAADPLEREQALKAIERLNSTIG